MRKILLLFLSIILFFSFNITFAGGLRDFLFTSDGNSIKVDCGSADCNLEGGVELAKNTIDVIEKNKDITEYVLYVIKGFLQLVSFIALVYIVYAGFKVLISGGEEEEVKKVKILIRNVIIGIVLIWLAYPITVFIIDVLRTS